MTDSYFIDTKIPSIVKYLINLCATKKGTPN